jgi:sepiapterin reductase
MSNNDTSSASATTDTPPIRWILLITGASRGFGRAVAQAWVERIYKNSRTSQTATAMVDIHLIARSEQGLQETADSIRSMTTASNDQSTSSSHLPPLCVYTHVMDLCDLDQLEAQWLHVLDNLQLRPYHPPDVPYLDRIVFINNAGTLGPLGPCAGIMTDSSTNNNSEVPRPTHSLASFRTAMDLNVTSALWMSHALVHYAMHTLTQHPHDTDALVSVPPIVLIQISSLAAVQPMPTMAVYSAGKAARDAYTTAWSHESSPHVRLLSYAPGPLETDMVDELRACTDLVEDLQSFFAQTHVRPLDSARVLVDLIVTPDAFTNGAHVDYYDIVQSSVPKK